MIAYFLPGGGRGGLHGGNSNQLPQLDLTLLFPPGLLPVLFLNQPLVHEHRLDHHAPLSPAAAAPLCRRCWGGLAEDVGPVAEPAYRASRGASV